MKLGLDNRWFLLIILALTWGSSFILIKKSLLTFSPYQIGAFRIGISGLILGYIGVPAVRRMPLHTLKWAAIAGFFGSFFPMFLFPVAQTRISSALAGILDSLVPLFVLVLGYLFFGVRSHNRQWIGAIMGLIGALVLSWYSGVETGESHWGYAFLIILATACYGLSALIIKEKLNHVPSLQLSSGIFVIWMIPAFLILVFSGFFSVFPADAQTWQSLGSLSILTFAGTTAAIVLYYKLIQDTSPVFASSVTYLLPVIAVIWGLIDGEKLTMVYFAGGALILLGIYLIQEESDS